MKPLRLWLMTIELGLELGADRPREPSRSSGSQMSEEMKS